MRLGMLFALPGLKFMMKLTLALLNLLRINPRRQQTQPPNCQLGTRKKATQHSQLHVITILLSLDTKSLEF
jgi:hypothetical protein